MTCILIVDDSAAMRQHLRASLEGATELGDTVEVVEASSGFEALRLLPRGRYDVVVVDINMPDLDGIDLIRFIRQSANHRDAALLIVSNSSSERDRERAKKLGADGFVAKPFSAESLRDAVLRAVEHRLAKRSIPPAP
jgi:two-component system chemotaxis response regulator CheY